MALCVGLHALPAAAQDAEPAYKNLQVLPKDIQQPALMKIMRGFSFSMGVRCSHCHARPESGNFADTDFSADEKPAKETARAMWKMVEQINGTILPAMPGLDAASTTVSCKTCHHGLSKPISLKSEIRTAFEEGGKEKAVEHYKSLREGYLVSGAYNFGEWEINTLAEDFADEDRPEAAIAIYELNLEHYPESLAILMTLGSIYSEQGDQETAVAYLVKAVELAPGNERVQAALDSVR
jgi:tetratricopeptide (TPR) repeat protein